MIYVKLVLRNVGRSVKDYLIYLATITLCVGLFYAFISLSSPHYHLIVSEQFDLSGAYGLLKKASFLITAVLIFLINYVNNYMIKRKKKEFALYAIMGMEQRKIALLFFAETCIMGGLSIIIGIIIGTLFSQVLTALIVPAVEQSFSLFLALYPDTVLITVVFFIVIFGIIGFYNIKIISNIKIIDMLNDSKKVEIQSLKSKRFYLTTLIISISGFIVSALSFKKYLFLKPLDNDIVSDDEKMFFLMISILFIIFAFYSMFYCLSYLIILIRNKFLRLKYKNTNLFLLGQLSAKLKTTSKLMATITLTLMASIILLSFGPVLSEWSLGYLKDRAVFDIQINTQYKDIYEIERIPQSDYSDVLKYLNENGYEMKEYAKVELHFINKDDFSRRRKTDFPVLAISLSDYNKLRHMVGLPTVEMKNNSYTTQWISTASIKEINDFLLEYNTLNVGNTTLDLADKPFLKSGLGFGIYNDYVDVTYVLPDDICDKLTIANTNFYGNTKKVISYDFAKKIELFINQRYEGLYINIMKEIGTDIDDYIYTRLRTLQINGGITGGLMMKFLCIYIGVVLIFICFTVLSIQQLSDSFEHKARFNVLKKIGVDNKQIHKLILKQMSIWFGIPTIVAFIGYIIFIYYFVQYRSKEIITYIGTSVFVLNIGISIGIIVLILCIYFMLTYLLFKRNIDL